MTFPPLQDADIETTTAEGLTALMVATIQGRLDPVQTLLEARADVARMDSLGNTSLMHAVQGVTSAQLASTGDFCGNCGCDRTRQAILELLLENGASPLGTNNEGVNI